MKRIDLLFVVVSLFVLNCTFCKSDDLVEELAPPPLLQASAADAQAPRVIVTGAESPIRVGELVQLSASLDAKPKDLYSVAYSWAVLPQREFVAWPDGSKIIFGTGTQTQNFTVVLTASYVYVKKDGDKILDIAQKSTTSTIIVQIAGGGQAPPPTIPTVPDPLTGTAKNAFDWTGLVARTNEYTDANAKADAKNLATSFYNIAVAIDQGTYSSPNAIMVATKDNNNNSISNRNAWLPWFTKMSEFLKASYLDGSIKTPEQFSAVWKEISKGLDAASR